MTEKTIADKLTKERNTRVWLSEIVHGELDGSIATGGRSPRSTALLLIAMCACAHAKPAPSIEPTVRAVPVYQEPRHRLVFYNALVRVLDVRVPPGDTTAYHVHADPLVGVTVQDARIWSQDWGAPPGPVEAPQALPSVFEHWSRELPYTHRASNVDTLPLNYVVAEWLASSGLEVPALPDGPSRRLIKEGPTARVYEITLTPGMVTDTHTHAVPGLTVLATSGTLADEGSTPTAWGGAGAGWWSWREAGYRHELRNDGATPLIVYEIDWR